MRKNMLVLMKQEDHASGQHLSRMDVHITSKCVSNDNQEFILIEKQALVHLVLHGASSASMLNLDLVNKQLSPNRLVKLLQFL